MLRAVPFDPMRALFDPAFEVSGCFLVPSEAARELIGAEHVKYSSQRNGRGPHAWNHHWLLVPLHDRSGEAMGFIWADDPEDRLVPSAERLQALRVFANQAMTALYAAEQFEQMRFLADHDPLTNLLNRRSFVQHLDAEVARSRRYLRPLALVILDLDELKTVNDTQGHAAGDDVLRRVADALLATIRTGDNAFRIGGDEFALILVEANEQDAAPVAQRIADELQTAASFGVAVCGSDCEAGALLSRGGRCDVPHEAAAARAGAARRARATTSVRWYELGAELVALVGQSRLVVDAVAAVREREDVEVARVDGSVVVRLLELRPAGSVSERGRCARTSSPPSSRARRTRRGRRAARWSGARRARPTCRVAAPSTVPCHSQSSPSALVA